MNDLWNRLDPGFFMPIWLAVGPLALLALVLLEIGAHRRRAHALSLFVAPSLLPALTGTISRARRMLKRVLLLTAVGLLFVAAARPHLLFQWSEESRTGLDLFLAIDCSRSMLTDDVQPNRLERAKLAVEDFAEHVPENRLGLVAFAGDAFLESPLTLDHDAFLDAVSELDTDTIPRPGTDIASAIDEAVLALKSQPNNLKFMILITDGEDLEGRVLASAKTAAEAGLKIYTVGVGTPLGGPIPGHDESGAVAFVRDTNGQIVQSKLDENALRQIAQITGGAYEPLGQRGEGLENIYRRYIATLPKQHLEERREKIRFERFEWPLGLAILLLIWEFLVRDRARIATPVTPPRKNPRRRPAPQLAGTTPLLLAGLFLSSAFCPTRAAVVDSAERDYKSGKYQDAAQKYGEALRTQPGRQDLQYDRGDSAYKAGGFTEAEEAFRRALETPNLKLQEDTYYNLGNTQFRHGEAMEKADSKRARELFEQSVHSYESSLKLKDAADTRHNYEIAKKKLEELKQQQKKGDQKGSQDKNKNGQNPQGPNGQNPQDQKGQGTEPNDPSQHPGNEPKPQDSPGDSEKKDAQGQPYSDKNASAQQRARSGTRPQDQHDPGAKNREEAESLLDSLKDEEHRVTARSLNGNNEPPPTSSGRDW